MESIIKLTIIRAELIKYLTEKDVDHICLTSTRFYTLWSNTKFWNDLNRLYYGCGHTKNPRKFFFLKRSTLYGYGFNRCNIFMTNPPSKRLDRLVPIKSSIKDVALSSRHACFIDENNNLYRSGAKYSYLYDNCNNEEPLFEPLLITSNVRQVFCLKGYTVFSTFSNVIYVLGGPFESPKPLLYNTKIYNISWTEHLTINTDKGCYLVYDKPTLEVNIRVKQVDSNIYMEMIAIVKDHIGLYVAKIGGQKTGLKYMEGKFLVTTSGTLYYCGRIQGYFDSHFFLIADEISLAIQYEYGVYYVGRNFPSTVFYFDPFADKKQQWKLNAKITKLVKTVYNDMVVILTKVGSLYFCGRRYDYKTLIGDVGQISTEPIRVLMQNNVKNFAVGGSSLFIIDDFQYKYSNV